MTIQNVGSSIQALDRTLLLRLYEQMETIRQFEDRAGKEFAAGKIPGFVHLYAGEEAVAVGVCAHLTDDDFITSHHRGHGHCLGARQGRVVAKVARCTLPTYIKGCSVRMALSVVVSRLP